jgi:hypothetical protein
LYAQIVKADLFDSQRNVTYWTAFIQEGLWAPYIGRPVYVPDCT